MKRSRKNDVVTISVGDALSVLRTMPDASAHCCVTSPPYYGLRDYGVAGQIGLEATPAEYVARLVDVFREVRRVLRDDGTLWLNLGDSYAAARGGTVPPAETLAGGVNGRTADGGRVNRSRRNGYNPTRDAAAIGFKHKDLIGVPWRVAFALQADGWYLRQDIIWHKPNPMPESVKDRCTKAHEYVFMLSKEPRYYFDVAAIAENASGRLPGNKRHKHADAAAVSVACEDHRQRTKLGLADVGARATRNRRSVWTIATQPSGLDHFAIYPEALVEPCILAGCPEGGVVLDPFSGAGTTGLVAARLRRRAVLIELNPDYAVIARRRVEEEKP